MAERSAMRLRRLAAEVRAEVTRVDRTVEEIDAALSEVAGGTASRLTLYGAVALLETFYTGIEKTLARIAALFGGLPEGPSWHRELLEEMALDLPKVRPPVLTAETVRALEQYLVFRHRFRNLYLFDLEQELVLPLLERTQKTWTKTAADLLAFAGELDAIADRLEGA